MRRHEMLLCKRSRRLSKSGTLVRRSLRWLPLRDVWTRLWAWWAKQERFQMRMCSSTWSSTSYVDSNQRKVPISAPDSSKNVPTLMHSCTRIRSAWSSSISLFSTWKQLWERCFVAFKLARIFSKFRTRTTARQWISLLSLWSSLRYLKCKRTKTLKVKISWTNSNWRVYSAKSRTWRGQSTR